MLNLQEINSSGRLQENKQRPRNPGKEVALAALGVLGVVVLLGAGIGVSSTHSEEARCVVWRQQAEVEYPGYVLHDVGDNIKRIDLLDTGITREDRCVGRPRVIVELGTEDFPIRLAPRDLLDGRRRTDIRMETLDNAISDIAKICEIEDTTPIDGESGDTIGMFVEVYSCK